MIVFTKKQEKTSALSGIMHFLYTAILCRCFVFLRMVKSSNVFLVPCGKMLGILLFTFISLSGAYAQKVINGKVTDEKGESLSGVTVLLSGSSMGTSTNIDGFYEISVPSGNSVLTFSYIGFKKHSETVGNRNVINVVLTEDAKYLDEVVVVGYGAQKRATLSGSVSQIDNKELMKAPMQNISNMLTGKLSGLTSIQQSGKPGADGTILYIRGLNTFSGGNNPMVIVDGVPRTMDYLNPNDIESVSILKDASASIYGVQGANGVILITTKSGSESPPKISYDGSYTATQNTAMPDFLNPVDYMYWHNKAREMDGLAPLWTADIQNRVINNDPNSIWGQTDWFDMIFRTGLSQQHNISASGGTEKVKYYTSAGLMRQEGTLRNTDFNRYNVRTNLDIKVSKDLRFIANLSGYHTARNWPASDIGNQTEFNPIRQAITTIPIIKSEYQGLPTAWQAGSNMVNPYAALYKSGYQKQNRWRLDSNFKLEYDFSGLTDILRGLKISLFGAYNYEHTADLAFNHYYQLYSVNNTLDESIVGATGYTPGSGFTKSSSYGTDWMLRPQIEYLREFSGKHSVGATLLFEERMGYSDTMTGRKIGYITENPVDLSMGTEYPNETYGAISSGSHSFTGQKSYIGRINYAFSKKYLAELAFRYDGSYRFAPERRWGFFPSASVGWVVSQEDFFSNAFPSVNYLKLRASYGQAGSDDIRDAGGNPLYFQYNSTLALASNSMALGGSSITQLYTTNAYIYRYLTWSSTNSYNLGIDFDMWKGKLGMELDLFYQLTSDILQPVSANFPPSLGGYYPSVENSGKVDNKGFEITLKHNNRINSDWSYGLKGNFSFARNKVLHRAMSDNHPNYRPQVGMPMNARYGFKALGFFQTQQEIDQYPNAPSGWINLGDLKYLDVNGDGRISMDHDYVKIGRGSVPEISFNFNIDVSYKNFYLSALWQGVSHSDYELSGAYNTGVIASTVYTSPFTGGGTSPRYLIEGAWTPENTNAKYPRLTTRANGNNAWQSSWWVINGEYLRLKNTNIGYSVPERVLNKTPFSRIYIYIAGTNLLTFSHFKYVDPESPSVSNGYYPQEKTYSIGANITF